MHSKRSNDRIVLLQTSSWPDPPLLVPILETKRANDKIVLLQLSRHHRRPQTLHPTGWASQFYNPQVGLKGVHPKPSTPPCRYYSAALLEIPTLQQLSQQLLERVVRLDDHILQLLFPVSFSSEKFKISIKYNDSTTKQHNTLKKVYSLYIAKSLSSGLIVPYKRKRYERPNNRTLYQMKHIACMGLSRMILTEELVLPQELEPTLRLYHVCVSWTNVLQLLHEHGLCLWGLRLDTSVRSNEDSFD